MKLKVFKHNALSLLLFTGKLRTPLLCTLFH